MKVIRWDHLTAPENRAFFEHQCSTNNGTALTIGGFDGPHLGHHELFKSVMDVANKTKLVSGVITFESSPGRLKKPSHYPGDVSTLNLRLRRIEEQGFDFVILIDFSPDFGRMTGAVFFNILVKTVCMRFLAVGPDFRCGHRLDTGVSEIEMLAHKEGFRFDSIQRIEIEGERISSSAIRDAVFNADFALAERLLGYPFLLDLSAITWKSGLSTLVSQRSLFTQILPRWGMYPVTLVLHDGTSFLADLKVTDDTVELLQSAQDSLPPDSSILGAEFRF